MHNTDQNLHIVPKLKDLLICDDVRKEDNGKHIFIGVYPEGNINILGNIPYVFPKLCFIVKFEGGKGKFMFDAVLKDPDNKNLISLPAGPVIFADEKRDFTLFIILGLLKIEKKGVYSLMMYEQKEQNLIFEYKFPIAHQEI